MSQVISKEKISSKIDKNLFLNSNSSLSVKNAEMTLLYNAKILASHNDETFYNWLMFNTVSGKIISIGKKEDNVPYSEPSNDSSLNICNSNMSDSNNCSLLPELVKLDLKGKLVLPGLHDSHMHATFYGDKLNELKLKGCASIEELKERLKNHYELNKLNLYANSWIRGFGWEQSLLGRNPTKEDLDEVCPDIPVYLSRACLHAAVINSKALEVAGITSEIQIPQDGEIEKVFLQNKPDQFSFTGLLKEEAMSLAYNKIPEPSSKTKTKSIKLALSKLLQNGVTAVHTCEKDTWKEFKQLDVNDQLPIRVFYSAFHNNSDPSYPIRRGEDDGKMLSCDRIKFFCDGSLGAMTAALSEPYYCNFESFKNKRDNGVCKEESCNMGMLLYTKENLGKAIKDVTKNGYQIEAHVIGDSAAQLLLDVLDFINYPKNMRPVFIHCQIMREDLLKRMKYYGAVANIQPQFVISDSRWIDKILPESLQKMAYPWKTLLNYGIACAAGSDAPVEEPNPLLGIFDSVHRLVENRDLDNSPVYRTEECLTLRQAIGLYTTGASYMSGQEATLGSLLPGYMADFVVLDQDIFSDIKFLLNDIIKEVWVNGLRRL